MYFTAGTVFQAIFQVMAFSHCTTACILSNILKIKTGTLLKALKTHTSFMNRPLCNYHCKTCAFNVVKTLFLLFKYLGNLCG